VSPGVTHYTIPIGLFYTGTFTHLIFANDHDTGYPKGDSTYTNVKVWEDAPPLPPDVIDFTGVTFEAYAGQDIGGTATVSDVGATVTLAGNTWKKIAYPYTITVDTVLEFDFSSSLEGEIHGIGFDNDDLLSPNQTFQLFGTQTWGLQNYATYVSPGITHYTIPIGLFYTGTFSHLIFANDHDTGYPKGDSTYTNVKVFEDTP
jgi:hypothetical protein